MGFARPAGKTVRARTSQSAVFSHKSLSNSRFEKLSGFVVHEVDVAAFHASGKENAIGVFDEINELVLGALDHGVARLLLNANPTLVGAINEILADDYTNVVELKALGGVDTANLADSVRIISP
jgi:hypothetical protein